MCSTQTSYSRLDIDRATIVLSSSSVNCLAWVTSSAIACGVDKQIQFDSFFFLGGAAVSTSHVFCPVVFLTPRHSIVDPIAKRRTNILAGHSDVVTTLQCDGRWLLSSAKDGAIRVRPISFWHTIPPPKSFHSKFLEYQCCATNPSHTRFPTLENRHRSQVWDCSASPFTPHRIISAVGTNQPFLSLSLSKTSLPDVRCICVRSGLLAAGCENGQIILWARGDRSDAPTRDS